MSRSVISRVIFMLVTTVGSQGCGWLIAPGREIGEDVCRRRSCAGHRPGSCRAAWDREPGRQCQLVWARGRRRAGLADGRSGVCAAGVPVSVRKLGVTDIAGQGGQLQSRLLARHFTACCPAQLLTDSRGCVRVVCNLVDYRQLAKERDGVTGCEQCDTAAVALHYRLGWAVW